MATELPPDAVDAVVRAALDPNANGLVERFMFGSRHVFSLRSDASFFEAVDAPITFATELEARQKLAERLIAEKKEIIAAIAENAERIEVLQGEWESII